MALPLELKLDGEKYKIDADVLTLGEGFLMEEQFGVEDLSDINIYKARHLRGLFFVAVKRKHPELSDEQVLAKVDGGVTGEVFKTFQKEIEKAIEKARAEEEDPPSAGVNGAGVKGKATTASGKTRRRPGTPASPTT